MDQATYESRVRSALVSFGSDAPLSPEEATLIDDARRSELTPDQCARVVADKLRGVIPPPPSGPTAAEIAADEYEGKFGAIIVDQGHPEQRFRAREWSRLCDAARESRALRDALRTHPSESPISDARRAYDGFVAEHAPALAADPASQHPGQRAHLEAELNRLHDAVLAEESTQ